MATTQRTRKPIKLELESLIETVRGQRVILDSDLARLYGVSTKVLNQAVKRNADRFPEDFVFQLEGEEVVRLRSQIVTSNGRGGRRSRPSAFTEHGTLMAANVIRVEKKLVTHDVARRELFKMIRSLLLPVAGKKKEIGFHVKESRPKYKTRKKTGK